MMMNAKAYIGNEPYVFVSYSHDDTCVQTIINELITNGYRIWYDEGIESGSVWADIISKWLKGSCQFIVFLSKNAVLSEYVKNEIHVAVKHDLNIHVVYLEEVALDGGLELLLDRKQAIYRQKYSTEAGFYKKLFSIINPAAFAGNASAAASATSPENEQYEKIQMLSSTPFVHTYKGIDNKSGLPVFIKHFLVNDTLSGQEIKKTAMQEISILKDMQTISCPYIPRLIDTYTDKSGIYIIEQFIDGKPLNDYIAEMDNYAPLFQDQCVSIILHIAQTLRYLHCAASPIVHRDIKPQNIIVTTYGDIFVVDFDCCLRINEVTPLNYTCLGTKNYAAPEQYTNTTLPDKRSDIYSLGIVFMQLLTKVSPSSYRINAAPFNEELRPVRYYSTDIDPILENIILKMTASNASNRFDSVDTLIYALKNYKSVSAFTRKKARLQSDLRIRKYRQQQNRKRKFMMKAATSLTTVSSPNAVSGALFSSASQTEAITAPLDVTIRFDETVALTMPL